MEPLEVIENIVPERVKHAIRTHQTHKLAMAETGLTELTMDKIAEHLGNKIATRTAKWRPIFDGFSALKNLRG